jgi:hypothetical protein
MGKSLIETTPGGAKVSQNRFEGRPGQYFSNPFVFSGTFWPPPYDFRALKSNFTSKSVRMKNMAHTLLI